jgi:L-lactate dehydrogenase complex protein LldF
LAARALRRLAGSSGRVRHLPLASGWTDGRDFPAPQGRTFRELYA